MSLLARLLARMGQLEPRHWVAMGASALLHLAVLFGLRQAPPPPPEPVSFEIALQPPEEERLKLPKAKATKAEKSPRKKLAKAKKAKPKVAIREPHTLEAALSPEKKPRKDVPAVTLPQAEPQQTSETRATQAPKPQERSTPMVQTLPKTPVPPVASQESALENSALAHANTPGTAERLPSQASTPATGSGAATEPGSTGMVAGGSAVPSGEAGLALAAARSMALAPGGGDVTQGAMAGASPGNAAEGANAGAGQATFSASGGNGGGLNLAAGSGANVNSATQAPPAAGGEPQGLRLTASGSLSEVPEFSRGPGGLASGPLAVEATQASPADGRGKGQALSNAMAGGVSVSPMQGPAAGPGKGGQGAAIERPAGARQAGGSGPAPGRLAGAVVSNRSLSGPKGTNPGGNSSQNGKSLALAPGEPGSGPQWAVMMVPVQVGAAMPQGVGKGNPNKPGGRANTRTATAPSGGDASSAAVGKGAERLARAGNGTLASAAPQGMPTPGKGGDGGQSTAPTTGATTPGGASPEGSGQGMTTVKVADQRLVQPDSKVETLDVLAPSNYCPLPIHTQPDNRPPKAQEDKLELPSYSEANPSFVYPVLANVYGVEGKLIMRVEVMADGTPGKMLLKQSSGNGILDRDAREQLARWKFNPARKNGQAVTAWVDVPVTYRLPEGRK